MLPPIAEQQQKFTRIVSELFVQLHVSVSRQRATIWCRVNNMPVEIYCGEATTKTGKTHLDFGENHGRLKDKSCVFQGK